MALTESVLLDISQAQRQIDTLEADLRRLSQPVDIPVDIDVGQGTDSIRREIGQSSSAVNELNNELEETERELRRVDDQADRTGTSMLRIGTSGASAFTNLRGSILGVGAAFVGIQGVQAFTRGAVAAIDAASDLAESLSKTNVVFGDFSGNIQDFAATGPRALGLSTQAALEATATFGNLFTALGLTQEAAADLSPDIVQLASDLASFNNISVDEAIVALRSGLVGEVEPLRRLGVAINAAAVEAKALELGIAGASGEVSEAAKVQARYALILEQTVNAQGDFARTADGVANRQRTLNAEFQNLQARIGEALLPAFESLLEAGPALITLIEGLVPVVESASQSFAGFVDNVQPLLEQSTKLTEGFGAFSDILGGLTIPVRQNLEILGSFLTLRWDDTLANVRETGEAFGDLFDRLQDRSALIGLANDLEAGIDPSRAFSERLAQVARQNDITAGTFQKLSSVAGLAGDELIEALRGIRSNAEAFDLDAQAVSFLNDELERLLFNQQEFQRRQPGGGRPTPTVTTDIFDLVIPDLFGDLQTISGIVDSAQARIDALDFQPLVDQVFVGAEAFTSLTDTVTAASEAIRTEGDEILESFTGFMDDLEAELATRRAFQDNLTLLRSLGLEDLAQTFQDVGLEAAQALAEAVADPAAAAEADGLIRENAARQAEIYNTELRSQLLALFVADPLIAPTILEVTGLRVAEIGFAPGVIGRGGDLNLTTNYYAAPATTPVSDAERMAQIIGSVIQNRTGGVVGGIG